MIVITLHVYVRKLSHGRDQESKVKFVRQNRKFVMTIVIVITEFDYMRFSFISNFFFKAYNQAFFGPVDFGITEWGFN
jgi:hypothetical protein